MQGKVKSAIKELTDALIAPDQLKPEKRAHRIVDACKIILDRLGLDFTEKLLSEQLKSVTPTKPYVNFINLLGLSFYRAVMYELANTCYLFRINLNPKDKIAYNNLGLSYNRLGKSREAADAYEKALEADHLYKQAGSNLLYLRHYIWNPNADQVSEEHKAYADLHYCTTENWMKTREVDLNPERKLRVGFLSADFRFHAVSRFIEGLFAQLNRQLFDVYVYHTYRGLEDSITDILKQYDIRWQRVHQLDVDALTGLVQGDQIDILIDLAVYTNGGVPDLLARQVAPVQINYMGYPDTSGIPALNYRITDQVSDPIGCDHRYSEELVRLPVAMWNYTPWPNIPEPVKSPFLSNGFITFGSMNNHAKLQREWLQVWAQVLQAVPNSKLVLKSRAMDSERISREIFDLFQSSGVSPDRIISKGFNQRPNDHFLTFNEIDICLDTLPYNGTTTTFDSLWMGVPVVTQKGELHVSRTSASILTQMGMADWVAKDANEFIEICRARSSDRQRLESFRFSSRAEMQNTTLGDAHAFTQCFETLLRKLWQDYCDNSLQQAAEKTQVQGVEDVSAAHAGPEFYLGPDSDQQQSIPEISIVTCASSQQNLEIYADHLAQSVGIPYQFIGIDNSIHQLSLAEAYNTGADRAVCDVIVFVHDDVFFSTENWGQVLLGKFSADKSIGLVGLAGTAYLQTRYPYWVAAKAPFIHGQVIHHNQQLKLSRYSNATQDQNVVALDGLMLAASRSVFKQHRFDHETFDGFHFYDLDFSVRVSETHRVVVTRDILVKHMSGGNFDDVWKGYRDRFKGKYRNKLVWSCMPGQPEKDSHKQRLDCHYPLETAFSQEQIDTIRSLGMAHPKHPEHS